MKRYVTIEKKVGETPLEAMEAWRSVSGLSPSIPLAYAGRLDPMASGTLLVLIGDECKQQTAYHGFDKEYVFEALLGFSTDTGDILGLAHQAPQNPVSNTSTIQNLGGANVASNITINRNIRTALTSLRGTHTWKYPRFSARTVRGVPMHELNLKGELQEEDIPTYTAEVKAIRLTSISTISAVMLLSTIEQKIALLKPVTDPRKALGADFRKGDIVPRWQTLLNGGNNEYIVVKACAVVSSGTYIRTLSEELGKKLNTEALALSIHRTTIGTYLPLFGSYGVWPKKF